MKTRQLIRGPMMGFEDPKLRPQKKYGNVPTSGTFEGVTYDFRSKGEYNWALWCQFRKEQGMIRSWYYERERIHFFDGSRNPRSYLPDFWIFGRAGKSHIEEFKGIIDSHCRSQFRKWVNERPEPIHLIVARFNKQNANGRRLSERYCERIIDMKECLKNLKGILQFI